MIYLAGGDSATDTSNSLSVKNRGGSKFAVFWESAVDDFGLPQGPGLVECSDGCKYSGEWETAFFEKGKVVPWVTGTCHITYPDGSVYEGFVESSNEPKKLLWRYGRGTLTSPAGRKEEGWWYNDKLARGNTD